VILYECREGETDSFQISLFNPTLDNFSSSLIVLSYRRAGDVMIGVLITFEALMICLLRGTPGVTFMEAILEKW